MKEGEYLEFSAKEELIARYKNKIKEIDCSISEKNVKRTADILKEMQQLASVDIDDYWMKGMAGGFSRITHFLIIWFFMFNFCIFLAL